MKIAPRGRRVFGPDPVAGPPPPFVVAYWRSRSLLNNRNGDAHGLRTVAHCGG